MLKSSLAVCVLMGALLTGCGARTSLEVDPPADAGVDSPDMDTGELRIDCGRSLQFATPRRAIRVDAQFLETPDEIVFSGWEVLDGPPGAVASASPLSRESAQFLQDTQGFYTLRFSAEDGAGRRESCEIQVESIVGPPRAICPEEELRTQAGVPLTIEGDGFDDFAVVGYAWSPLSGPSTPMLIPTEARITVFSTPVTGRYELQLTVFDEDGASNSCVTRILVIGPPTAVCPEPIEVPTRQPASFLVQAMDDTRITSGRAQLVASPPRSEVTITDDNLRRDGDDFTVTFTPDRVGDYSIRVTITDEDGLTASCEMLVVAFETPPDAICPEVVETRPLTNTMIEGSGVDDGEIVAFRWELIESAEGSTASGPSPANAATTNFMPDIAGEYRMRLTVRDDSGNTDSCETLVRAIATEGLRVEMFWDTRSDMDLHLLRPGSGRWRTEASCYYANCLGRVPDWGTAGVTEDNPSLDIDNTSGFGPENINVELPENGEFRVGVHAFSGAANSVTVRIYCGGSTTEPRQTFGPVRLSGSSNDFWRVADVEIDGDSCTIRSLEREGGPDIRNVPDGSAFDR